MKASGYPSARGTASRVSPCAASLGDIEGIRAEKPIDFFFELHELRGVEGVLEHFGREDGQRLEEVDIWAFVRLDLRLKLNEGLILLEGALGERGVLEDDPAVGVRHPRRLFVELLFLRG
eukprot:CAMPEP_0185581054 /NCGR_PEP_ID=MMETSP0434-20130131/18070_1 /TAXON_ID=626734 ORGANISM="Favella taraikaensis, Strain Fe Narragansett Bay" /NCGR_SAMPLE_ID=MMETSP0434 /ASSEMBLY_ACC=CAM_ASM_000379 /LENGTH=119 /DNA_ID=CAMNT_0028199493 /DNA_START=412 /DNA_END=772 /DNA_ORIENTATION=+